jgi:hypothetical protein
MTSCPYCGKSLEKENHPLVGYLGGSEHGTEVRECRDTGQRFKKELCGRAAGDACKEYESLRPQSGEDVLPESGGRSVFKKLLKILSWI